MQPGVEVCVGQGVSPAFCPVEFHPDDPCASAGVVGGAEPSFCTYSTRIVYGAVRLIVLAPIPPSLRRCSTGQSGLRHSP